MGERYTTDPWNISHIDLESCCDVAKLKEREWNLDHLWSHSSMWCDVGKSTLWVRVLWEVFLHSPLCEKVCGLRWCKLQNGIIDAFFPLSGIKASLVAPDAVAETNERPLLCKVYVRMLLSSGELFSSCSVWYKHEIQSVIVFPVIWIISGHDQKTGTQTFRCAHTQDCWGW